MSTLGRACWGPGELKLRSRSRHQQHLALTAMPHADDGEGATGRSRAYHAWACAESNEVPAHLERCRSMNGEDVLSAARFASGNRSKSGVQSPWCQRIAVHIAEALLVLAVVDTDES